jgi:hypothetical protein
MPYFSEWVSYLVYHTNGKIQIQNISFTKFFRMIKSMEMAGTECVVGKGKMVVLVKKPSEKTTVN